MEVSNQKQNYLGLGVDGVLNSDSYFSTLRNTPQKEHSLLDCIFIDQKTLELLGSLFSSCNFQLVLTDRYHEIDTPRSMLEQTLDTELTILKAEFQSFRIIVNGGVPRTKKKSIAAKKREILEWALPLQETGHKVLIVDSHSFGLRGRVPFYKVDNQVGLTAKDCESISKFFKREK